MKDKHIRRDLVMALAVGMIVLGAGFISLYAWWQAFKNKSFVGKGFKDYYAAFWGDRIALPLLAASLLFYFLHIRHSVASDEALTSEDIVETKNLSGHALKVFLKYCLFGVLGGGLVQISWLIKDDVNWTFSKAHRFNGAGIHHAIFFAMMCGLLAGLLRLVAFCRHRADEKVLVEAFSIISLFVIAFSSHYYLTMHFLDDGFWRFSFNLHEAAWVSVIVSTTVLVALLGLRNKHNEALFVAEIRIIISGEIVSAAAAFISVRDFHGYIVFVLCFLLLSIMFWRSNGDNPVWDYNVFCSTLPLVGLGNILLFQKTTIGFFVTLSVFLVWIVVLSRTAKDYPWIDEITIFGVLLLYFGVAFWLYSQDKRLISDLFRVLAFAGVFLGGRACRLAFVPIKKIDDKEVCIEDEKIKKRIKALGYCKIIMLTIPCASWMLYEVFTGKLGYAVSMKNEIMIKLAILIIVFYVLVFGLAKVFSKYFEFASHIALVVLVLIFYFSFILFAGKEIFSMSSASFAEDAKTIIAGVIVVISSLFQVVGSSILIGTGFYYNTFGLRSHLFKDKEKIVKIVSLIVAVMNILAVGVLLAIVILSDAKMISLVNVLCSLFIVFLLYIGVPVALNWVLQPEIGMNPNWGKTITGSPKAEILKDGFLSGAIMLLATGIPIILMKFSTSSENCWVALLIYVICAMSQLVSLLEYCIENNRDHFRAMVEGVKQQEEEDRVSLSALSKWLRIQSWAALGACLLYGAVLLIWEYNVKMPIGANNRKGIRNYIKSMIADKYP